MSKKAPDTRNKLDNNKQSKKKTFPKNKEKRSLKDLSNKIHSGDTISVKVVKKESNGSVFKKTKGYSKTMKRNMHKNGVKTLEEYAISVRKPRKLAEKKARQKKHSEKLAYRRLHGKSKGKKGQPAAKKEKSK